MPRQLTEEQKAERARALKTWRESGGKPERKSQILDQHTIRHRDGGELSVFKYSKTKAIKLMCFECFGFNGNPRKECVDPRCPLYPFRGGVMNHNREDQGDNQDDDSDD